MGPERHMVPLSESGGWVDNVKRMLDFIRKHPEVSITTPRQNDTRDFIAVWVEPPGDENGKRTEVRDRDLGRLMDHVEERFGRE